IKRSIVILSREDGEGPPSHAGGSSSSSRLRMTLGALSLMLAIHAWAQAAPGSIPPVATEPAPPGPMDIEIGYRTLSLKGSEDLYRTQINERHGVFIRSMTLLTSEPVDVSWIDRLRIDGTEIGPGS